MVNVSKWDWVICELPKITLYKSYGSERPPKTGHFRKKRNNSWEGTLSFIKFSFKISQVAPRGYSYCFFSEMLAFTSLRSLAYMLSWLGLEIASFDFQGLQLALFAQPLKIVIADEQHFAPRSECT